MFVWHTCSVAQPDMSRLSWNYARRPYANRPWIIVGAFAFVGCLHGMWWRDSLLVQRDNVIAQAQHLPRKSVVAKTLSKSTSSRALESVFAEMQYPWTEMLDRLHVATPTGVELLTLEPEASAIHRVRINGVANQPQSVLDLLTALQRDPAWSSVRLISQAKNETNAIASPPSLAPPLPSLPGLSSTASSTLTFSLIAEWRRP